MTLFAILFCMPMEAAIAIPQVADVANLFF
jgi:hypothetical protein